DRFVVLDRCDLAGIGQQRVKIATPEGRGIPRTKLQRMGVVEYEFDAASKAPRRFYICTPNGRQDLKQVIHCDV
ncbi:MAG: hypothetical protein EBT08_07885, partial [Betaproteobacteria bacterium]|nr:hypothetical protein [Betaproteobacteria bacterium]